MDFFLCNTDLKKNIKMRTYNKQTKKKKQFQIDMNITFLCKRKKKSFMVQYQSNL